MIGYKEHPFFRCNSCGLLVDDDLINQGVCVGHQIKPAGYGTFTEWIWMERRKFKKYGDGLFIVWLYKQFKELRGKSNNGMQQA